MAAGNGERRQPRPKSVSVADADAWLHSYVYQDGDDPLPEDIGATVELPYDLATALELWTAWRDHGTLPRAGGYLDQPRAWRSTIRFMNSRHAPIHAAHLREQDEERENRGRRAEGGYDDSDLPIAQGWGDFISE